jgi:hypothetical protein
MTLQSTIVAGNYYSQDVVADTVLTISGDHNLVGTVSKAGLPGDTIRTNPMLGGFGNYGGGRRSVSLLPGSPAIDAGIDANFHVLTYDERGAPFSRKLGGAVDIGAYEFDPSPIFANGFEKLEN